LMEQRLGLVSLLGRVSVQAHRRSERKIAMQGKFYFSYFLPGGIVHYPRRVSNIIIDKFASKFK